MSVAEQTPVQGYTANGVTTAYSFPFTVLAEGDLGVMVDGALQTLNVDYTVTGVGGASGTVTFTTAPANAASIVIYRDSDLTRATDYQDNGDLLAATVNRDFDRLWLVLQEMLLGAKLSPRAVRAPVGETLSDLPAADVRANRLLSFDAAGNVATVAPDSQDASAVAIDLAAYKVDIASTASGKGASLVGVQDSASWFTAVATKTVETVLAWIGKWIGGQPINVFEYMTAAEIASVKAYNFSVDVTAAVQAALTAGWADERDVFAPAGGYKIDAASLVLPGTRPTPEERAKSIRFYGQGYGNPFSNLNNGGTVFKSVSDRPILTDNAIPTLPNWSGVVASAPTVAPDAQGTITIDHIRFDGTSTTPVVLLNSASGIGEYHHFVIYQRGTGDGLYIGYGATAKFHHFYVYNKDYVTTGLGAARTGVGVNFPNSYGSGLVTFRKCTSRGWHDGYIIGRDVAYAEAIAAGKDVTAFHTNLTDFEVSVCHNGVTLKAKTSNCAVLEGYFEGCEDGEAIRDDGVFNSIIHNQIFAGFAKGIVLGAGSGYGGVCSWNEIATSTRENTTCIEANMNLGLARTVTDNTIVFGSSGTGKVGVVGMHILGLNPQLNMSGNMFNPKIAWSGGAGTVEILDASTSSLSAGSGVYGIGTAKFDNLQVPLLNQGAISLAKGSTNITDVVGGGATGAVLLTAASSHVIAFTGAKGVTSFTAPNIEGKFFVVRVTNGNCTFTNGASLKMAGAVNYTPGAGGAIVTFLMHSNIAYEVARTAF